MATTIQRGETATNISTLTNKIIQAIPLPYEQTRDYSTFLQQLGSNASPNPGLGTSTSSGTFSRSIPSTTSLVPNSKGKVSPSAVYNAIRNEFRNTKLAGFVPKDGKLYGIDGTESSYVSYMTQLVGWESGFNTTAKGDIGKYRLS